MTEISLTGGCLCGQVRFVLSSAPILASYCHCTRCQRRTGTGSSANVLLAPGGVEILSGSELLVAWSHPDGGWEKLFCRVCGGHVLSRNPDDHREVSVRMGAFDGDPGIRPSYRNFVAYAAPWEPIPDDGLRRYPESGRLAELERLAGGQV